MQESDELVGLCIVADIFSDISSDFSEIEFVQVKVVGQSGERI